ncbi:TPR end-of-group domain-containing protein [Parachryseolinea silvisoli]|uniref:TPR end-of-group domain-containing protein n=1 Tax=Parachryseolinea silvisoli TaxID=2873601 RepID=UPI002265ACE3|nr:WGR domain-containing protein [Parachryseolinea silvisoli]MCD9019923.1 WGR domain-containing protein [Parachryseolinea silvisoli]
MRKFFLYLSNEFNRFWQIEVLTSSCTITITEGRVGTFGKVTNRVCASEKEALKEAVMMAYEKQREGYFEGQEGFIKRYELPRLLKESLLTERTFIIRDQKVALPPAPDIRLISVLVEHQHDLICPGSAVGQDPYGHLHGVYCTTAYELAMLRDDTIDRRLIWLPLLELYARWDAVQKQIYIYPDRTWSDIEQDIAGYLDPAPGDPGRHHNIECSYAIWDYFDFKPYNLPERINEIINTPAENRRERAEEFMKQYEMRLLRHPATEYMEDAYNALVTLYHLIGQWYEEDADYYKAVKWFERSLLIVHQLTPSQIRVFADIFLQLSFCYLEMSRFDLSLLYINLYQRYDPTSQDACEQIRDSIERSRALYEKAMESYWKALETVTAESYEEAIRITHQALDVAPNDPALHFNLACFYSIIRHYQDALYYFEQALRKGFNDEEKIRNDEDLRNIRDQKEFAEILNKYFR